MNKHFVYVATLFSIINQLYAQSMQDLQKMKVEYEKLQKNEANSNANNMSVSEIDPLTGMPKVAKVSNYKFGAENDTLNAKSKFFGYNFFTKRDSVAFWENLPTPANYLLGPGDEIVIAIWGATQLRQSYTISRDGNIYDDKVGLLPLMGKTIKEGEKYLLLQFGKVYSTLNGSKPSSYLDISLGKLQSINVNFVGQVNYPGVYPVHPFSNVIIGLIQAGGVDTTGSLRNIKIVREDSIHSSIDLYNYFIKGSLPKDIQLRDQDIVVVPVRNSSVTIDSAVYRAGIYESKKGESIKELIEFAGGIKINASPSIGIKRIVPLVDRDISTANYSSYYIDYKETGQLLAQDGDIITVPTLFEETRKVEIIGQVKRPGVYYYYPGMKLKDLILLGGGFNDPTFSKSIHLAQGELVRRDPISEYEKIIIINLNGILNDSIDGNILLENLDRFVVHANRNFFERKNIKILGEVEVPGSYPLLNDNESLESIINRSGGLSPKALDNGISIFRLKKYFDPPPEDKILKMQLLEFQPTRDQEKTTQKDEHIKDDKDTNMIKLAWQGMSLKLMPGDSIMVHQKVGAVFVTGEVYSSGLVEYQDNKSIRYYINSAGGINNYGNRNNVVVVYPNGITVPWRYFSSPKIIDGTTIVVYQKADSTAFDYTLFASNMTSLLSSLVTIMLLTQQINSN